MRYLYFLFVGVVSLSLHACSNLGDIVFAPIEDKQGIENNHAVAKAAEKNLAIQKVKSVEELSNKAVQGDYASTLELGRRYAMGNGVEQNGQTALRLYQAVANTQSDYSVIAQSRIGRLYLEGVMPIKQDMVEAYIWFDRIISDYGKQVVVEGEAMLRYHNFARLNLTDAERLTLKDRLAQTP